MPQPTAAPYNHRLFIFVQAGKLTAANNLAAQWDPDSGGGQTFGSLRLSPGGQEPATHYAAATYATDSMRSGITQALSNVPFAGLYSQSGGWTWETACADLGLSVIQSPA